MYNTTQLVHKYLRNHLSISSTECVWYVWKYELLHKIKVGQWLEIRHLHKHLHELSNPESILRIKRKLLEQ